MDTSAIKMIVTDLDGTFMDDYNRANAENVAAVSRARDKDFRFCANTGRTWTMAHAAVVQADFDDLVMTTNGAAIVNKQTQQHEYLQNINPRHLLPVLKAVYAAGKRCELYCGQFIAVWRGHESSTSRRLESGGWLMPEGLGPRIERFDTLEEMAEACADKTELFSVAIRKGIPMPQSVVDVLDELGGYDLTVSHNDAMDIISKGTSKANTLGVLADRYGLDSGNVIAFGDNINDIEMIKWAGIGVAMGNADERLKRHADIIAEDNTAGGVAKTLHRLLGV